MSRLSLWLAVYLLGGIVLVSLVAPMGLVSLVIVGAYVFVMSMLVTYETRA